MRDRIQVLHFIASFCLGGSERQVANLVAGLRETEFEPHVACFRAEGELLWLSGSAENNAAVAAAMRAIEQAAAAAEPAGRLPGTELILLERRADGRDHFEMRVRSAKLSTP